LMPWAQLCNRQDSPLNIDIVNAHLHRLHVSWFLPPIPQYPNVEATHSRRQKDLIQIGLTAIGKSGKAY
jgi:hypothetical protein